MTDDTPTATPDLAAKQLRTTLDAWAGPDARGEGGAIVISIDRAVRDYLRAVLAERDRLRARVDELEATLCGCGCLPGRRGDGCGAPGCDCIGECPADADIHWIGGDHD